MASEWESEAMLEKLVEIQIKKKVKNIKCKSKMTVKMIKFQKHQISKKTTKHFKESRKIFKAI